MSAWPGGNSGGSPPPIGRISDQGLGDVRGRCRVLREGQVIYDSGELLSGEKNMCHSLANMEDHHFKFPQHRQPGDIHVHMFGTATLSFADGIKTAPGDVFEISESQFGLPLRNSVAWDKPEKVKVKSL